mgnify:CR=1 FL=1
MLIKYPALFEAKLIHWIELNEYPDGIIKQVSVLQVLENLKKRSVSWVPELTLNLVYIPFEGGLAKGLEEAARKLNTNFEEFTIEAYLQIAQNYSESVSVLSQLHNQKFIKVNKVAEDPIDKILEEYSKENGALLVHNRYPSRGASFTDEEKSHSESILKKVCMTPKHGFFKPIFPQKTKKIERVKQPSKISRASMPQRSKTPNDTSTKATRIVETGVRVST